MSRLTSRNSRLVATLLAVCLAAAWAAGPSAAAVDARLSTWEGGISLYRVGTFTTQKSWLWCTAADVQIIRNIAKRDDDHSTSGQRRYFNWMRGHNRYNLPLSAGVDPQGWTAGLRHFVDSRYRLVASKSFDGALRSAVTNLRRTNLPVAVAVSHGNHGWVLTGFTATADPARTKNFKVTSVRVVGPLFGLQSKNGYDMGPNTKLTTAQFRRFFTAWHYVPKPMIWDGLYVSIQPIPAKAAPAASPKAAVPAPTIAATVAPSIAPRPSSSPTITERPSPMTAPTPLDVAALISPRVTDPTLPPADPMAATGANPTALLAVVALLAVIATAAWRFVSPVRRRLRRPDR